MPANVEQRTKEVLDGDKQSVTQYWTMAKSGFKELTTPAFKKVQDIGPLAQKFDAGIKDFKSVLDKQDKIGAALDAGADKYNAMKKQSLDLHAEIDDIVDDEKAADSLRNARSDGNIEDRIDEWSRFVASQQDMNKSGKMIYDKMTKLADDRLKVLKDCYENAKKEIGSSNGQLTKINNDLNDLESKIRSSVIAYSKIALDMNRKDIADAVRKIILCFG